VADPETLQVIHCNTLSAAGCSANTPLAPLEIVDLTNLELGAFTPSDFGFVITASASASPPGSFSFVQLLGNYSPTHNLISGGSCTTDIFVAPVGGAIDKSYPYGNYFNPAAPNGATTASDSPLVPLLEGDLSVTMSFSATMFVMWTPNISGTTIPVPLGSVAWSWSGEAVPNSESVWIVDTSATATNVADFAPSATYPQWVTTFTNPPPQCK
jgi:hypothetical protein